MNSDILTPLNVLGCIKNGGGVEMSKMGANESSRPDKEAGFC
jgi:hypothetical protein